MNILNLMLSLMIFQNNDVNGMRKSKTKSFINKNKTPMNETMYSESSEDLLMLEDSKNRKNQKSIKILNKGNLGSFSDSYCMEISCLKPAIGTVAPLKPGVSMYEEGEKKYYQDKELGSRASKSTTTKREKEGASQLKVSLKPSSMQKKLDNRSESKRSIVSLSNKQSINEEPIEHIQTDIKTAESVQISNVKNSVMVKSQISDKIMLNRANGQQMLLDQNRDYMLRNK